MPQSDNQTAAFLRMTAIELREIAEIDPGISRVLNHIADQLEAEAADIETRIGRGFS